jgi:hypothetical protein
MGRFAARCGAGGGALEDGTFARVAEANGVRTRITSPSRLLPLRFLQGEKVANGRMRGFAH